MSDFEKYQAGLEGRLTPGYLESAAYRQGRIDRMRGAVAHAGNAAPGALLIFPLPVLLGLMLFLASVGIVIAAILFPVGGGLTIIAWKIFDAMLSDPSVSPVVPMFGFLIPGFLLFIVTMILEGKLAQNRMFRRLRYAWRMVTGAVAAYGFAGIVTGHNAPNANPSWGELLPVSHVVIIAVCLLVMHFLSRKLDRGYDDKNVTLRQAVLARRPIPSFRESAVGEDDEEVRRRIGILRKYLDGLEEAGLAKSARADETRAGLRDLNDLLDVRERTREELAAIRRAKS